MSSVLLPTAGHASRLFDLVGRTPLIRLHRIEREKPGIELYGKAEFANPGGSVKDRPARRMMLEGLASGALAPGKTLLDATSGNTGIAYAMFGAAIGVPVVLCVPDNVTAERKRMLRAYGAELVLTDPLEGSDGAIREARRRFAAAPDGYFYPDQYNNPFNWRAHYDTTAPELIEQTAGRLTHFVAGLGTSGTFVGVGRRLRELLPGVVLASLQPESPLHGIEGLKHMATAIVPGIYDPTLADVDLRIDTERAVAMTRRLAREEGLLVGISAGASVAAALALVEPPAVVVTVLCDGGERYLSEAFWEGA
ncbi:MAG TPA: PLP-dependent cysteine synthase family protein [Vicinamibacterales bacterium]|nr:PLP-dependent cysteine synthase family protein [Vicinamibacterales bacterium]